MTKAKVVVVGPGAMGTFYYWKFYQAGFQDTVLLADGQRAERLRQQGLSINGQSVPARVVEPEQRDFQADLILVAVKYHHLPQVLKDMANIVGKNTLILSVMNGIDSEEILAQAFGWDKVLYAIALGIDALREDGQVRVTNEGMVYFGEAENAEFSPRVERVQGLFDAAGIASTVPEDMIRIMWWKFMINVGVNQTSAVLRAPFGVYQRTQEAKELMLDAMYEVIQIEEKKDISLTQEDVRKWLQVMEGLDPEGKTSMCQDVLAGRKTEVEMFAGALLSLGQEVHVPTPVNQVLFKCLRSIEQNYV